MVTGFTLCFLLFPLRTWGPGTLGRERETNAEKGNKLRKLIN